LLDALTIVRILATAAFSSLAALREVSDTVYIPPDPLSMLISPHTLIASSSSRTLSSFLVTPNIFATCRTVAVPPNLPMIDRYLDSDSVSFSLAMISADLLKV
jgi:hypothetical protein